MWRNNEYKSSEWSVNKHDIISARPDLFIIKLSCIIQIDADGSKDHNIHMQQIFDRFWYSQKSEYHLFNENTFCEVFDAGLHSIVTRESK